MDTREMLIAWHVLWSLIRRDLGHDDSDLEPFELAASFLVPEDAKRLRVGERLSNDAD